MANVGSGTSRVIIDPDGEAATVTSNRLDVNATLVAGTSIDIGDVDIHLSGNVPLLGNAGDVAAGVLRVTLASDDPAVTLLGTIDADTNNMVGFLTTIDADTGSMTSHLSAIKLAVEKIDNAVFDDDSVFTQGLSDVIAIGAIAGTQTIGADKIGALSCTTGGALKVDIVSSATLSVNSHAVTNAGTFATQVDGDALTALQLIDDTVATLGTTTYSEASTKGNVIGVVRNDTLGALAGEDNEIAPLQVNSTGALYINGTVSIDANTGATEAFNVASSAASSAQRGIIPLIKMNEEVSAPTGHVDNDWTYFQTDLNGSLYTTHGITGAVSSKNSTVGTSIEDLSGSNVACKRVDMMASPDNTGYIWVGGTNTGVGQGIRLSPGDFYSVDIDNTEDIQVIATVDAEDISYVIYT